MVETLAWRSYESAQIRPNLRFDDILFRSQGPDQLRNERFHLLRVSLGPDLCAQLNELFVRVDMRSFPKKVSLRYEEKGLRTFG